MKQIQPGLILTSVNNGSLSFVQFLGLSRLNYLSISTLAAPIGSFAGTHYLGEKRQTDRRMDCAELF